MSTPVIRRNPGNADNSLQPLFNLATMPEFQALAREIDNGWLSLEAQAERIAEDTVEVPDAPKADELARIFLGSGNSLLNFADEARAREAARSRMTWTHQIRSSALGIVSDQGVTWVREHQPDLCRGIATRRAEVHGTIRTLARELADVRSEEDFKSHPEAVPAYQRGLTALSTWDVWATIHERVLNAPDEIRAAERVWPGVSWVASYLEDWRDYWFRREGTSDPYGQNFGDVWPPFQPDPAQRDPALSPSVRLRRTELERIHQLATVTSTSAPTIGQIRALVRHLNTKRQERINDERRDDAQNRGRRVDYMHTDPIKRVAS